MKTTAGRVQPNNLCRLLPLLAACLIAWPFDSVRAVPASPEPVEVTQPDGTKIRLRLRGDEYFSWHETTNGYVVVKDAGDGFWKFARPVSGLVEFRAVAGARVDRTDPAGLGLKKHELPETAKLRAHVQERREAVHGKRGGTSAPKTGISSTPSVQSSEPPPEEQLPDAPPQRVPVAGGSVSVRNIVILACFSNHWDSANGTVLSAYGRVATNEYVSLYNQTGYTTDGAAGSVKDYYNEVSYGKLTIQSVITAWVQLPREEAYYHDNQGVMAADAIAAAAAAGFDFSQGDTDGDGWVDCLDIIHSGYGEEAGGGLHPDWVWSVKGSLSSLTTMNGVKMKPYHTEPALRGASGSGIIRIGVICHETGHFFGLPDLYDTSYLTDGLGNWCIMSGGSWNGSSGSSPAHFSAWCKVFLGFAQPMLIHSKNGVALPRVENNAGVGMLRDGMVNGEYFMVENRAKTGFDNTAQIYPGLLVYHIAGESPGNNSSSHPHPLVRIEEADGDASLGFTQLSGSEAGDVWTSTSGLTGGWRDQTGNTNTSAMLYQTNTLPYQTNLFYDRPDNPIRYTYNRLTNFSAAASNMTFNAQTLKTDAPTQNALPPNYTVAWAAASEATKYEIQEGARVTLTSLTDGAEDADTTFETWQLGGGVQRITTNGYAGTCSYAMLIGKASVHALTLRKPFMAGTGTLISFRFKSHISAGNGYLKVQISKDAGVTWNTLLTTNGYVDSWALQTNNYAALNAKGISAGDSCIIRFLADIESGSGWSSYPAFGFALDDISIAGVEMDGYGNWTTLNSNVTTNYYPVAGKTNSIYAYRIQAYANGAWQGYGATGETTVGANHAPTFISNPVAGNDANIGKAYSATLASLGTDLDSNDVLTYSKISGPAWLTVATNGTLSGTPVPTDLGTNTFTVRMTDLVGAYAEAQLIIFVNPPSTPLSSGLVAYLPFDADFRDYSGLHNDPGLSNVNVRAAGYLGGKAYVLTNGGYLSFGLAPNLHFNDDSAGNTNSFSISFWAKIPPGSYSGEPPYIANKDWLLDGTGWTLASGPGTSSQGFFQMNFDEDLANPRNYDATSTALTNGWHHYLVVFQRNGTRTCYTYIDGSQADSQAMYATDSAIDLANLPLNIGQDGTGAGTRGRWTNALMDDFGFWRRALTAAEVTAIYSAGTNGYSLTYAEAAPVITNQPTDTVVAPGSPLNLNIGALSAVRPAYQWRFNGAALANATNAAYTIASVAQTNFGNYDVVVTNLYGTTFSRLAAVASPVSITPTNILATVSGNSLILSWPGDHTGWTLQTQTNSPSTGLGTNWVDVPGSSSVNRVTNVTQPVNGSVFYRLKYKP